MTTAILSAFNYKIDKWLSLGIQDKSWQQPFKKLPMTVNFVQMGTDPNSIQQQLDSLKKSTKTLFLGKPNIRG